MDVARCQELGDFEKLLVEAADWRAAIAGDKAGGVEPGATVARLLRQQQADDCLRAVEQHVGFAKIETVGEREVAQRLGGGSSVVHGQPPRVSPPARLRRAADEKQICEPGGRNASAAIRRR